MQPRERRWSHEIIVAIVALGALALSVLFAVVLTFDTFQAEIETSVADTSATVQSNAATAAAMPATAETRQAADTLTPTLTPTSTGPAESSNSPTRTPRPPRTSAVTETAVPTTEVAAAPTSTPTEKATVPPSQPPTIPTITPSTLPQTPTHTSPAPVGMPSPTTTATIPTSTPSTLPQTPTPTRTSTAPAGMPSPTTTATLQLATPITPSPSAQPPTPSPGCSPPSDWVPYTVRSGENLFRISLRAGVSYSELQEANCLPDPRRIQAGQVIYVPPGTLPATRLPVAQGSQPPTAPTDAAAPLMMGCTISQIRISAPAPGATLSDVFAVRGTATLSNADDFSFYKVEIRRSDEPDSAFRNVTLVDEPAPGPNDRLATLDPALFGPGEYLIRLTVVDVTSNYPQPCTIRVTFR